MGYWILSIGLVVFGFVAAFSIGMPFLMVGGTLLVLGQVRHRAVLFWPPLAAVVAFNVGYWATVPLYCGATSTVDGAGAGVSTTTCQSLLGGTFTGTGIVNPSLDPANEAGLGMAAVAFVVVLVAIIVRRRSRGVPPGQSSGRGTPSTLKPPST